MHFLLFYDVSDDYLARRGEFRAAHLDKAWASHARGELVLGGALADPVDGACRGRDRADHPSSARCRTYRSALRTAFRASRIIWVVGRIL